MAEGHNRRRHRKSRTQSITSDKHGYRSQAFSAYLALALSGPDQFGISLHFSDKRPISLPVWQHQHRNQSDPPTTTSKD